MVKSEDVLGNILSELRVDPCISQTRRFLDLNFARDVFLTSGSSGGARNQGGILTAHRAYRAIALLNFSSFLSVNGT